MVLDVRLIVAHEDRETDKLTDRHYRQILVHHQDFRLRVGWEL